MDMLNDYGSDDSDNESTNNNEADDTVKNDNNLIQSTTSIPQLQPEQQQQQQQQQGQREAPLQQEQKQQQDTPPLQLLDRQLVNAAPTVSLTAGRLSTANNANVSTLSTNVRKRGADNAGLILMNNPTKMVMYQPIQGPQVADPIRRKVPVGTTEINVAYDTTNFNEQRTAFQRDGIAHAPVDDGNVLAIRTTLGYTRDRIDQMIQHETNRPTKPIDTKQSLVLVEGSDDEAEYGIWGPPTAEERFESDNAISLIQRGEEYLAPEQRAERNYIAERNRQKGIEEIEAEEESAYDRRVERKMAHLLPPVLNNTTGPLEPTTTFHGSSEVDYKGRSWMAPPAGMGNVLANGGTSNEHHRCKVPKKCVHRFIGHNQGVHRIRLFPVTGHLLLSGGLDGKCKVWSIPEKQVMRTYIGHRAAVRDVQFNNTGQQFISASFDRYIRLWDTESGKVLQTFTNKKVPYVLKFYPHDDNYFVAGCSDNKIVTYDIRTGDITQEYNHHLGPVNAIVFIDDGGTTKMITSSDDKKILVWEWDIGVPIKYISDPTMHSMPCMTVHPSQNYFVGQSLDNTIVVFSAGSRIAIQRKKKFSGHIVSGYACEIDFSPDGQYMISGDGTGSLFVWDWKRHKILQKFRAHDSGPTACCVWHPLEPSTIFTCGWDGIIKMWQ